MFHINWSILFALMAFAVLAWLVQKNVRKVEPFAIFSSLSEFGKDPSLKLRYAFLPQLLKKGALVSFCIALLDPHVLVDRDELNPDRLDGRSLQEPPSFEELSVPREGIAIYLVLDQSGSMREAVEVVTTERGGRKTRVSQMPKVELLRRVTSDFVMGNPDRDLPGRRSDLVGLVGFARVPQVLVPLTLDHKTVKEELSNFDAVKRPTEDGTAIGYAIYKTTHLIKATKLFGSQQAGLPSYDIRNTIMILVTDGIQFPSPLDADHPRRAMELRQAAEFARDNGVRVYMINVEPAIELLHYVAEKKKLEEACEITGGKFYVAGRQTSLFDIYRDIDQLEKSLLPQKDHVRVKVEEEVLEAKGLGKKQKVPYYPHFVGIGLCFLLGGVLLDATWLRRCP